MNGNAGSNTGNPGGGPAGAAGSGNVIPPQDVLDCGALPAAGTFEKISPPGAGANFAFVVDPVNAGTVYLGTDKQGIWKSEDCGATWVHINTGRSGAALDSGMNWTLVIDPTDPQVLYSNAGYGTNTNGAYKSSNGGVDWDPVWPPADGTLANIVEYDFANVFAMDPADHNHLLLTFHAMCKAPYNESCIGETMDGGETWRLVSGDPQMVGTEGQVIYFLDTPETWFWGSQTSGFWRTDDSGTSWAQINPIINEAHPQGSQMYRAQNGTFYLAAADGISRSDDGITWSLVANTGPLAGGIVSDGTTMYMSNSFYWNWGSGLHPYFTAPENVGEPWTQMPGSPPLTAGGSLGLDLPHRILYSSNLGAGFWRVVLP
jgi:hypothetical protein